MEMQQVRYFITLAKTLNFTRAAEECNVSQPSLTRAIRLLEAELGGELVRRERRQSHLTELGQRMLPLLQKCYESALSAKQLATAMKKNEVAPLSIAMSQTINIALLMPQLNELSRAYPGVQFKIRHGAGSEISQLMKDGEAELPIAGPIGEGWDRLDHWPLADERFDLVVNREHGLAAKDEVAVSELKGERFLRRAGCEMFDESIAPSRSGTSGQAARMRSRAIRISLRCSHRISDRDRPGWWSFLGQAYAQAGPRARRGAKDHALRNSRPPPLAGGCNAA